VQARTESVLGFRVPGKIMARQVEAGSACVRAGAGAVGSAGLCLGAVVGRGSQVVAAAQADLEVAQAEYRRYEELRTKNFVSELDLERKRVAAAAAEARLAGVKSGASLEGNRLA
jgi:multidrug efflux system membrane fusion protein